MWNELSGQARSYADRLRVAAEFAKHTGMMWNLSPAGMRELVKVFASSSQNPSKLYRVHAQNTPDKLALVWRDQKFTWRELDDRIDRFAGGLKNRGIGRKQSLILMMRNRPEHVLLSAAATRIGAASVAISWRSTAAELAYLANHSGARGIVLDPELLPTLEEARPNLAPDFLANVLVTGAPLDELTNAPPYVEKAQPKGSDDDAAVVIYTSGTTGKPKGAVRKFPKDTMAAAMRFINETPMRFDDIHLVTAPMYHSTAFGFLAFAHMLGNTAIILDEFKPEIFLQTVEKHGITTSAMVPTMLHRVLELPRETRSKYNARSLRCIVTTGAALPAPLANEFMDEFGDIIFNLYGSTETGFVTLAKPNDLRNAPGTIGKAIPGNEIRLLDDEKRDVGANGVGELYVKNKVLVAGYHKDDKATSDSMVDGYFSVGDLARRDRDGRYFIEGRKRDMVISGGVNVYPAEVEGVLEQHPNVAECAVIGVEDREWGERVRAFVVAKPGTALDEADLKAFMKERLAGPKVPRDFIVIDALPRNPTGKVLKRELRERPLA
jgi:fatty-acyl-CoA synthase